MAPHLEWAVVGGLGTVAAAYDLRFGRVPNVLTFGGAAAGLVAGAMVGGWAGLLNSLLGCMVGLVLFFPLFAVGGMGAGDVKLLAAFGAWLGPADVLWTAIWASLAGGAFAVVVGLWRGYLLEAMRNLFVMVAVWRVGGASAMSRMTLDDSPGPRLAYALPIGVGALLALWRSRG